MASFSSDENESFEVAEILDQRGRGTGTQYLVRWKGYESGDDTWEVAKHLKNSTDIIEKFKKDRKTPSRTVKNVEKSVSKSASVGSRSVTTTTITKITSKSLAGSQSESSSPESSPRMSRRSTFTSLTTQTTSQPKSKLPARSRDLLKFCKLDIPIIIVLICFLFIVLTFIIQPAKK